MVFRNINPDRFLYSNPYVSYMGATDPTHYRENAIFQMEPVELLQKSMKPDCYRAWLIGSTMKYIYRYEKKNGIEDLDKAKVYIDFLKADLEGKEPLYYLNKDKD